MKKLYPLFFLLLSSTILFAQNIDPQLSKIIEAQEVFQKEQGANGATQWPDYSKATIKKQIKHYQAQLADLAEIDQSKLSASDQINQDMLQLVLEDRLYNLVNESYLMPLNAEGGFLTGMVYRTQNLQLKTEKEQVDYLAKLKAIPAYLAQQTGLLKSGLKQKKVVPKIIAQNCIGYVTDYLNKQPKDLFLAKPLHKGETVDQTGLSIIKEDVLPAFQQFHAFLEKEYLPQVREEIGVRNNKDGKAYYEQRVRYFTTLDMTPDEVFEIGQKEVARIRAEMDAILEELAFEGSYADFLNFLRTDEQFYAKTGDELLAKAAWYSKKAEEILPRYFGKLPRLPFTVNPVPDAIAPKYTSGRYSGGSMESQRAGQYWVNTHNLKSRPLYALPALTLHEAVPGHHLQGSLAQEIENVPKFRTQTYLSAFGEGWALYTEYLGKEAGIYKTPYEDFGRLTYEMWRACRLVVDPGMHYKGWTRQEALDFMASNTALSIHEVTTEIDRYIGWPGQAVSYKIGELKIRELRKKVEAAQGDKFDIRAFHDLVLANGSIPLSSLERIIAAEFLK